MRFSGRVAAAIEVLSEIFDRHRPASEALKDWGKAHRFAGSSDRHCIGTLVYDALRKRNSLSAVMNAGGSRALVLGALRFVWNLPASEIEELAKGEHGPGALSVDEKNRLESAQALTTDHTDVAIAGDIPQWLVPSFIKAFGDGAAAQGAALAERAPIDLRVNTLKCDRAQLLESLQRFGAEPGPLAPTSIRIPPPDGMTKPPNVEAEPAHGMGWFEVQDSASQIAAMLSGAKAGERVADICAGAGGKTLALAAMMGNTGSLVATDQDRHRLRPIFERMGRAGASIIEVVAAEQGEALALKSFDRVIVDAPCSGSGAWRRKADAKWRLTEKLLEQRIKDQQIVLRRGADLVKPGGVLTYVTCSVLPQENNRQIEKFLGEQKDFTLIPFGQHWEETIGGEAPVSADGRKGTLLLTPHSHNTDGFFIAVLRRRP